MISPLLMDIKQLSEFEKGHIVAYKDCSDIRKKLNCHNSSVYIFFKNYKKTGNHHKKKVTAEKREKPLHLMLMDILLNIKRS